MIIYHYSYDDVDNPCCGGGGAYRELMVHRLLARRHTIICYTGMYKGAKPHNEPGIRFRRLGFCSNYLLSRIIFSVFATIHSLFVKADLIVIGYSVFAPVLTFLFRKNRTILEFYHLTGIAPVKKYPVFGFLPLLAERLALRYAVNFVTLTRGMAELISDRFPDKLTAPAFSGYDESLHTDTVGDHNYILCFGRIDVHMKGLDILVAAFERVASGYPSIRLTIAGRGTQSDINRLNRLIIDSPARRSIRLMTNVTTGQKRELFRNASFLCMPSRFEGWCISAVEAAACRKATLGTKIMGLGESVLDGETGLLVPVEDIQALADTMTLLIHDRGLRSALGSAGQAWARNFTWERVAKLQEDFYIRVAGARADKQSVPKIVR